MHPEQNTMRFARRTRFLDGHAAGLNPYNTIGTGTLDAPKGIWTTTAND
jgi:hypothetical protein